MWPSYSDHVHQTSTASAPQRAARAVVVAALVTPAVLAAHVLTRGVPPGPAGLLAVTALVTAVAFVAPLHGTRRLAAAVVAAQLAGHAVLAATTSGGTGAGCLPAVGRGAQAGLDLALLRTDVACAPGTMAAGAGLTALLGALLTAVVLLAGQVLVGSLTATVVVLAERVVSAVRDLVAAVLPALPAVAAVPVVPGRPVLRAGDAPRPVTVTGTAPATRRGPPVAVPA